LRINSPMPKTPGASLSDDFAFFPPTRTVILTALAPFVAFRNIAGRLPQWRSASLPPCSEPLLPGTLKSSLHRSGSTDVESLFPACFPLISGFHRPSSRALLSSLFYQPNLLLVEDAKNNAHHQTICTRIGMPSENTPRKRERILPLQPTRRSLCTLLQARQGTREA
jgi:hypothetical protein